MPELAEADFLSALGGEALPTNAVEQPVAGISVPPLTATAVADALKKQAQESLSKLRVRPQTEADFASKLGARPGIPFDTSTGVPLLSRIRMGFQPTPEEEVKALEAAYGKESVRVNQFGQPIVTVLGEDRKPKDVLANPLGVDFGDIAGVIGQAPELAGLALGTYLSRGKKGFEPGFWQALKTLVGSVVGSEGAGVAKDVAIRAAEDEDIRLKEIAGRRAIGAGIGLALGGAGGLFAKTASKVTTPFATPSPLNFDARRAAQYFQDRYGVALPLTPGELTGSMFLQRAESMALQKPGSSIPIENLIKERNRLIQDVQTRILGGTVPDEEEAAQRAIAAIGGKVAPLEQSVAKAGVEAGEAAEREILSGVSASTGITKPVNKSELGRQIREKAFALRERFQAESNKRYGEVFNDPLTKAKNIPGDQLAQNAKKLLDRLPAIETITKEASPLADEFGRPILRDIKGKEVLREFVPDGVLNKLRALEKGQGQQFRLDELMQMRREVDNDIAMGESVPGVQTKYLTQIREVLTDRIKTGLKELDPALLAKWENANNWYAKEVPKFKRSGIAELFRDPEQLGYLENTALVNRATSGKSAQDFYQSYKSFFGQTSQEVTQLKRAIADDVLDKSPLSDTIDGNGFVRRLEALASDAPDVLKDVFGLDARKLRESGQVLKQVQKGNLPEDELVAAVNSGNISGQKLLYMLSRQAEKDQAYRNKIVKAIGDSSIKAEQIKPTEFVNKFAFKAEPSQVKEVITLISDRPDVLEDIRRLSFKKVLDDATFRSPNGEEVLSGVAIENLIKPENAQKRLRAILGNETFGDLEQLANFLKAGEARQQVFKAAGGIGAGQQISGLVERGELKYVGRALANFVTATLYTSPPLRSYFGNTVIGPKGSAVAVNYAVAAMPFVEGLVRTYGGEVAREHATRVKASIDQFVLENPMAGELPENAPQSSGQTRSGDLSEQDFLNALGPN